jgi:hypothetical protein
MGWGTLCVDRLGDHYAMRIAPSEIEPGMWVKLPEGTGMVLDVGKGLHGGLQLGILLEHPPTDHDYFIANCSIFPIEVV